MKHLLQIKDLLDGLNKTDFIDENKYILFKYISDSIIKEALELSRSKQVEELQRHQDEYKSKARKIGFFRK
jgi:hypothetical protein